MLPVAWRCHPIVTVIPAGLFTARMCGLVIGSRKPSNDKLPSLRQDRFPLLLNWYLQGRNLCCGSLAVPLQLFMANVSAVLSRPPRPWGHGHRNSAKKACALALVGAGGSLPCSFLLLLLSLNSTDDWAFVGFSKTAFLISKRLLQQHLEKGNKNILA